jgi:hypothetical protein
MDKDLLEKYKQHKELRRLEKLNEVHNPNENEQVSNKINDMRDQ